MANIFLGIGHGGSDPGAVANGYKEKGLNLAIGLYCRDVLVAHGHNVLMSRETDKTLSLSAYIRMCNEFGADYAADIHNNAGGGKGAEVYHHYPDGKGKELAENILAAIEATGQNSRGAKTRLDENGMDYYGFIRETNCPAVIVECAFVDNAEDVKRVATDEGQCIMGEAIAYGILAQLGEKPAPTPQPEPEATPAPGFYAIYLPELSVGSKGGEVETFQTLLNAYNGAGLTVDAIFGPATEAATKAYQRSRGLPQTGKADLSTWNRIIK